MKYILFTLFLGISIVACAQIVNIEDRRTNFSDSISWHETANLAFNWDKNESFVFNASGGFQLEFQYKKRILLSITHADFIRAGGKSFVNQGFQHLRYTYLLNPIYSVEAFGQIQYNEQLLLKLRALAGSGIRIRVFKKGNNGAHLGVMYMYEHDEESNNDIIHRDHRMSNYLTLGFQLNKHTKISSTTYYQPLFNNFSDFRLSTNSNLIFTLFKKFDFNINFSLIYDSRAPENAPELTHKFNSGFKYTF